MKAQKLNNNLHSFLALMDAHVEFYLRYALLYPFMKKKRKKKLVRFFKHLFLVRAKEFIKKTKCNESGIENQTMHQVRDWFIQKLEKGLHSAGDQSKKPQ